MSSFAGINIDVEKDNVHYLISSSNKCIQGMAGISFVVANLQSLIKTKEIKPRNFYFNLLENHFYLEKNKQFLFTPPVQTLYALRQAIDEYFKGSSYSFDGMHDYLFERGFTIYPGKVGNVNTFRLSNIGAIYPSDIENFLKVFEEYLRMIKII
jgi:2-aminoethylphosphonate-pyruvate transaminase